MLNVTQAATERLAEILESRETEEGTAVRFVHDGQSVGLREDNKREGDQEFEHDGRTVLLLDSQMSDLLANHTLDVDGSQLMLKPPAQGE